MNWIESITEANIDRFITPVGVPLPWPGNVPPAGYLECNGAPFDINKYRQLTSIYPIGKLPKLSTWYPNKENQFIYIVKAK
ncbi:hypothetical protein DKK69_06325 [Gilliamella apicola]|nr:hypothetical protein DKK69_06325 [Gilliamella apicola]